MFSSSERRLVSRAKFAAATATAFAGIGLPGPARAAEFQWKWAHDFPAEHSINVRGIQAFSEIRKATNGRLDITAYPNSLLGNDFSMLSQMRLGAIEMISYAGSILDAVVPLASIEGIAFAYPNLQSPYEAMDGELGALVRKDIVEIGKMMPLERVWENGWRDVSTAGRPIKTVDDFKGLKIRISPSKLRVDIFKSLGATPVPMPPVELYTALQTHIVDGQESPLTLIEAQRWYEVQRFASVTNHVWGGNWNIVNMDKWHSLPPDLQAILRQHLNKAAMLQRRDSQLLTASMQDKLRRQGLEINTPDLTSFRAKLVSTGFYGRWKAEYGDKAWTTLEKYTGKLG